MRSRARIGLFILGVAALLGICLYAHGGPDHLLQYSAHFAHKFTARAMMEKTLAMDRTLYGVTMNDEQVYDGAGFTNWGFGVPLLQIPFHALVPFAGTHLKCRFFPDRLIFFVYLAGLVPLFWTTLTRATLAESDKRPCPLSTWLCSWSSALLALAYALFPLLSFRFIVYEETIAYFVVAQLYALCFYVRFVQSKNAFWVCAGALAAGMGLLIRPTGVPYLALWGALCVLGDRRWRTAALYCGTSAPLVAFWLYSNWVKGGSPWTLGYQNGLPEYAFHYAMQRFGDRCEEVRSSSFTSVKWLFESFFLRMPDPTPIQTRCHYLFEVHTRSHEPFFPPTVLVILCGSLFYHAVHKRAVAYYLPQATFVALFLAYARSAVGFTYRYAADFWPLVILVLVHLAPAARLNDRRRLGLGLGLALGFYGFIGVAQDVAPALSSIAAIDGSLVAVADEEHARVASIDEPMLPARVECGEALPPWPRANGKGWGRHCEVDVVTNLFLGVLRRTDSIYHLRFKTDHPASPSLRVYINGGYYDARLGQDDYYKVEFELDYKKLYSPGIMVAVEWTRDEFAPPLKLMEIELE
jgi:hypothetical protein